MWSQGPWKWKRKAEERTSKDGNLRKDLADVTNFERWRKGPGARECWQPLEAGKARADGPLESLEEIQPNK